MTTVVYLIYTDTEGLHACDGACQRMGGKPHPSIYVIRGTVQVRKIHDEDEDCNGRHVLHENKDVIICRGCT